MSEKSSFFSAAFSEKYRLITGLILGFLGLVLLVLIYNIYMANRFEQDNTWAVLSGRQAQAASGMTNNLLELKEKGTRNTESAAVHQQLRENYGEFSEILFALQEGGQVSGGQAGLEVQKVKAIPYDKSGAILDSLEGAWERYRQAVLPITTQELEELSQSELDAAVTGAMAADPEMKTLLSSLYMQLEEQASGVAGSIKLIQILFFLIAPIYCGAVLYFLITRLRQNDLEMENRATELSALGQELEGSKEEIDNILNSVSEGLFLLDKDLKIGTQHSAASLHLFNIEELSGKNFLRLFHKLVPAKTYDTAKKYMALVFKPHIEESTLAKFNPFKDLEVHFDDSQTGGLLSKHLDFRFKRIFNGKKVEMVMVSVSDVTERIKLERQLAESEEATQRQLEMMLDILHCDVTALDEFLESSEQKLRSISSELKGDQDNMPLQIGSDKIDEYRKLLDRIFRFMHTIKGNAAMIQLRVFESKAHEFEEVILEIKNKRDLHGGDFLPITVALSEMLSYIKEVRELMDRMGDVQSQLRAAAPAPTEEEAEAKTAEEGEQDAETKAEDKGETTEATTADKEAETDEAKTEDKSSEAESETTDSDAETLTETDTAKKDSEAEGATTAEAETAEAEKPADTAEAEEQTDEPEKEDETAETVETPELAEEKAEATEERKDPETADIEAQEKNGDKSTETADAEEKPAVEAEGEEPKTEEPAGNEMGIEPVTVATADSSEEGADKTEGETETETETATAVAVAEDEGPKAEEESAESTEETPKAAKPTVEIRSRPAASTMVGMLSNLAENIADKHEKKVQINAEDFDEKALPQKYKFGLRDILVQLVRNSVIHGIEPVEEREVEEKLATGTISLKLDKDQESGEYWITLGDDGRGLPREKLQKEAVARGLGSADEVTAWTDDKLYALIFDSGVSTAEEVTEDAGRGVGMDVVRETIDEMGGTIEISSKPGRGCEFVLILPKVEE